MPHDEHPPRDGQTPHLDDAAASRASRGRQVVDFRPYPTASTRTRRSPANPAHRDTRRANTPPTPSTIWFTPSRHLSTPDAAVTTVPTIADPPRRSIPRGAADAEQAGADWPLLVLARAVTSFTEPGAAVLLLPWPAARDEHGETVPLAAVAAVAELGRRPRCGDLVEPTEDDPGHPGTDGVNKRVDLVVIVMRARHGAAEHTDRVARLAAAALRLGGVLTVLTHCDRHGGVLVDPTGPMVTAGQNADLLYLQHVVAVHLPPADLRRHDRRTDDATNGAASGHRRVHSDVLVFAQPHDNGARPTTRTPRP